MLFGNIPSYNWERIAKKAKTLEKYGCSVKLVEVSQHKKGEVITIDLVIPESLEAGKWEFMGVKKSMNDDVLYFGNIPAEYKNTSMYCEHCNSKRYRKSVILIKDMETGEVKQVGKTCVVKYLGNAFSILGNLLVQIDEILDNDGSDYEGGYSFFSKYVDLNRYLYFCLKSIKEKGYIKKNTYDARGEIVKPTVFIAIDDYDKTHDTESLDYSEVVEAIETYKDFVAKKGQDDDFTHNVLTLLNSAYMERKYINYVAFIPTFLLNKRKFEAEKKAKDEARAKFNASLNNSYLGHEKEKVTCKARLIHYHYYETHFTYNGELNCMYTFMTENGQLVQWKTQKEIAEDLEAVKENKQVFSITGTVKECKEFKGRFYTVLTRCKVS